MHREVAVTPNGTSSRHLPKGGLAPRGTGTLSAQDRKARGRHTFMRKIGSRNDDVGAMMRIGNPGQDAPKRMNFGTPQTNHAKFIRKSDDPRP